MFYTNYTHYLQVRQDLGLADHVWQDKRALIAQSVDNLGDQFRPAMRAGWLTYIRRAYPADSAEDPGPVVGEDMLVVPDWVYANPARYKQLPAWWMMLLACCIQRIPSRNATFYFGIMQIIEKIIAIIVI
jgi:hypothetical protein